MIPYHPPFVGTKKSPPSAPRSNRYSDQSWQRLSPPARQQRWIWLFKKCLEQNTGNITPQGGGFLLMTLTHGRK